MTGLFVLLLSLPAHAQHRAPAVSLRASAPGRSVPLALPAARLAPAPGQGFAAPTLTPTLAPILLPAFADAPASANRLTPAQAAEQVAARLAGTEILLIQALPGEDGRRHGYDLSNKVEEIVKAREGQVRNIQRDGPAELFADSFAIEVTAAAKDEVLAELRALEKADVVSLSELLALGSRRVAPELPDAETLKGYAERLKEGTLASRWSAFAELATMLENAGPQRIAALPAETRDALVIPLYHVAADAANAFSQVQGGAKQDLRQRLHEARGEAENWSSIEEGAQQGLKHPGVAARFSPLRSHLSRALGAMDRLDTDSARRTLMQALPHGDYAGLELAARPERAQSYVNTWLADIAATIAETREGLLAPQPQEGDKENKWTGSNRSGGYTHVAGSRQSKHLYQWRPYRFDPAESRNELLLLLGIPGSGANMVAPLLALLEDFQSRWPELQELNKRKELAREYKGIEGRLAYYKKQAEEQGKPYTEEQLQAFREHFIAEAEEKYRPLDGHSVIDRLLTSFAFYDSWSGSIPGFDAAAYVANVLAVLQGATQRIEDRSIVAQLADGALHFLTAIAASDVLKERPELRASATTVWRALADKTAAMGIILNTRLDGVIDPRPEKRLEPQPLESVAGDATVWQLAPSPDGRFIAQATGDRRIRVWDAATRALVTTIELDDARQLYGDLANSLGVSWDGPRLRVTTLHDGQKDDKKVVYNLIRTYDLRAPQPVRNAIDAVREDIAMGVYVLRENSVGAGGPFYASPMELRNEQHHYLGAEVRLIAADGRELAKLEKAQLLDLKNDRLLSAAPGRSQPQLQLWNVSDPAQPQDTTPDWLRVMVAQWRERNPPSEYGWHPSIHAKLGTYQGRPALLWVDQGRLNFYDLATGAELRSLEIPSGWTLAPYLTNADGTRLAAIVTAPGQFAGPNPERVVAWDLTTGELLMDHDATYVPTGWLYMRGQSIAHLDFSGDRRLIAAGRKGVQVFELP